MNAGSLFLLYRLPGFNPTGVGIDSHPATTEFFNRIFTTHENFQVDFLSSIMVWNNKFQLHIGFLAERAADLVMNDFKVSHLSPPVVR